MLEEAVLRINRQDRHFNCLYLNAWPSRNEIIPKYSWGFNFNYVGYENA